jgi:hypothetical protein
MKKSVANRMVGRLGQTNKMPCKNFGLSPSKCRRGNVLRNREGTVCSNCYAYKGNYHLNATMEAHQRRYTNLDRPFWPGLMAEAIGNDPYFRWFDSGDVQSLRMLDQIMEICKRTPKTRHWLPTRETGILRKYLAAGEIIPANLTIRISLDLIDGDVTQRPIEGLPVSVVSKISRREPGVYNCPSDESGELGCNKHHCRACWDPAVEVVNYVELHQKD